MPTTVTHTNLNVRVVRQYLIDGKITSIWYLLSMTSLSRGRGWFSKSEYYAHGLGINRSYKSMNRWLNYWEREGMLIKNGDVISVRSLEYLSRRLPSPKQPHLSDCSRLAIRVGDDWLHSLEYFKVRLHQHFAVLKQNQIKFKRRNSRKDCSYSIGEIEVSLSGGRDWRPVSLTRPEKIDMTGCSVSLLKSEIGISEYRVKKTKKSSSIRKNLFFIGGFEYGRDVDPEERPRLKANFRKWYVNNGEKTPSVNRLRMSIDRHGRVNLFIQYADIWDDHVDFVRPRRRILQEKLSEISILQKKDPWDDRKDLVLRDHGLDYSDEYIEVIQTYHSLKEAEGLSF